MNESLDKKIQILDEIIDINKNQEAVLKAEDINYDDFERAIALKEKYIDELNRLDSGFQAVYDRIKESLNENRHMYAEEIRLMQGKIRLITEKSMDIQSQEARNKEVFQGKIHYAKKEIKTAKTANKVAANYYQSMNRLNVVDSQFLDTKK